MFFKTCKTPSTSVPSSKPSNYDVVTVFDRELQTLQWHMLYKPKIKKRSSVKHRKHELGRRQQK